VQSEKYAAKPELLRQHPILKRLLTLKQSLSTLEELNFNFSDSEDEYDFDDDLEDDESIGDDESLGDDESIGETRTLTQGLHPTMLD